MSGDEPTAHAAAAARPSRVMAGVDVVVPTVGRPSLQALLDALGRDDGPLPRSIVLVDDRADTSATPLAIDPPSRLATRIRVLRSGGRGPAGARNVGWRHSDARWIAFLDDDVLPPSGWAAALAHDLADLPDDVAGSQARLRVPLPAERPPTDWERNVAGLEHAHWATADLAYRRDVLAAVGGFDERFPRAYREDADVGLRIVRTGYRIVRGRRVMVHPVRPTDARVSVRLQAGNADDPLLRMLHGRGWRAAAGIPRGRRPWHALTTTTGALALLQVVRGRRMSAATLAVGWGLATLDFAWRRIAPGPRTRREVMRMLWTSVVIPPVAVAQWCRGWLELPARLRRPGPVASAGTTDTAARARRPRQPRARERGVTTTTPGDPAERDRATSPAAVLFDRDGTLVVDVPYNGDPERVRAVEGAAVALARLRRHGVRTGVVSNQSGVARGLLDEPQVARVNARVDELLGPFDVWRVCCHDEADGCPCRKPAPGMILDAAKALGVAPRDCVVIGDTGADVQAAMAAGARGVLVPTARTLAQEVAAAPEVAPDLATAVARVLRQRPIGTSAADAGDAA